MTDNFYLSLVIFPAKVSIRHLRICPLQGA